MNQAPSHYQLEIAHLLFNKVDNAKQTVQTLRKSNPDYAILGVILSQLDWLLSQKRTEKAMAGEDLEELSLGIIAVRELDGCGIGAYEELGDQLSDISYLVDQYRRNSSD